MMHSSDCNSTTSEFLKINSNDAEMKSETKQNSWFLARIGTTFIRTDESTVV